MLENNALKSTIKQGLWCIAETI